MTEETTYATIAAAEQAIIAAGYQRDSTRHVWVNASGRTAKVVAKHTRTLDAVSGIMRPENNFSQFSVQRG